MQNIVIKTKFEAPGNPDEKAFQEHADKVCEEIGKTKHRNIVKMTDPMRNGMMLTTIVYYT